MSEFDRLKAMKDAYMKKLGEPPHCPTCGCGMEPSQAEKDALYLIADKLVESAPLHGHGRAYDDWFTERERYRAARSSVSAVSNGDGKHV